MVIGLENLSFMFQHLCLNTVFKHSVLVYCVEHSVLLRNSASTVSHIISHTTFSRLITVYFQWLKNNASLENPRVGGSIPPPGTI